MEQGKILPLLDSNHGSATSSEEQVKLLDVSNKIRQPEIEQIKLLDAFALPTVNGEKESTKAEIQDSDIPSPVAVNFLSRKVTNELSQEEDNSGKKSRSVNGTASSDKVVDRCNPKAVETDDIVPVTADASDNINTSSETEKLTVDDDSVSEKSLVINMSDDEESPDNKDESLNNKEEIDAANENRTEVVDTVDGNEQGDKENRMECASSCLDDENKSENAAVVGSRSTCEDGDKKEMTPNVGINKDSASSFATEKQSKQLPSDFADKLTKDISDILKGVGKPGNNNAAAQGLSLSAKADIEATTCDLEIKEQDVWSIGSLPSLSKIKKPKAKKSFSPSSPALNTSADSHDVQDFPKTKNLRTASPVPVRPRQQDGFTPEQTALLKVPLDRGWKRILSHRSGAADPKIRADVYYYTPQNKQLFYDLTVCLLGWSREFVYRAYASAENETVAQELKLKKGFDVYYYTPDRVKLRSNVQVAQHLQEAGITNLTGANFSYGKFLIGHPNETERHANPANRGAPLKALHAKNNSTPLKKYKKKKKMSSPLKSPTAAQQQLPAKSANDSLPVTDHSYTAYTPTVFKGPLKIKLKTPGSASAVIQKSVQRKPPARADASIYQKATKASYTPFTSTASSTQSKNLHDASPETMRPLKFQKAVKSFPKSKTDVTQKAVKSFSKSGIEIIRPKTFQNTQKAVKSFSTTPVQTTSSSHTRLNTIKDVSCSISCLGRNGAFPSLHCGICLALFHPECVGLTGKVQPVFVCAKCLRDHSHVGGNVSMANKWNVQSASKPVSTSPVTPLTSGHFATTVAAPVSTLTNLPPPPPLKVGAAFSLQTVRTSGSVHPMRPPVLQSRNSIPSAVTLQHVRPPALTQATKPPMLTSVTSLSSPVVAEALPQLTPRPTLSTISPAASPKVVSVATLNQTPRFSQSQPNFVLQPNQNYVVQNGRVITGAGNMPGTMFFSNPNPVHPAVPAVAFSLPYTLATPSLTQTVPATNVTSRIQTHMTQPQSSAVPSMTVSIKVPSNGPATSKALSSVAQQQVPNSSVRQKEKFRAKRLGVNPAACHIQKLHAGYDVLLHVFYHLNYADLLRASCVCRIWHNVIKDASVWRTIRLKDSSFRSWGGLLRRMKKYNTVHLDFQDVRILTNPPSMLWQAVPEIIESALSLKRINFGKVPSSVLLKFVYSPSICKQLKELTADAIIENPDSTAAWCNVIKFDIGKFSNMQNLQELKIRALTGMQSPSFQFSGGMEVLPSLKHLRKLSLTNLRDIREQEFSFLGEMLELESLELGDCRTWSSETYYELGKLVKLRHLHLEAGGEIPDVGLADAIHNMHELATLELIMFTVPDTLISVLPQLPNLRNLSIWPDVEQADVINTNVFCLVMCLPKLKRFDWGVACETDKLGQQTITAIPFLPLNEWSVPNIPGLALGRDATTMSVTQLMENLCPVLPKTKIRVLRVPIVKSPKTK